MKWPELAILVVFQGIQKPKKNPC